jgi:hypothetical protein
MKLRAMAILGLLLLAAGCKKIPAFPQQTQSATSTTTGFG